MLLSNLLVIVTSNKQIEKFKIKLESGSRSLLCLLSCQVLGGFSCSPSKRSAAEEDHNHVALDF